MSDIAKIYRPFTTLVGRYGRETMRVPRVKVELMETILLSRYACPSVVSQGRLETEAPDRFRTCFARDRDRIVYSDHYPLLAGKTQVFSPESLSLEFTQIVHNRHFHVEKVAQVARSICRALRLNEDLAEAIALGHDLGHSIFGHEGEKILDELSQKYLGIPFKHNRQSLRVVRDLEKLNLSVEVMNGILCHDGERKDPVLRPNENGNYFDDGEFPMTLEGCVVRLADRIAYLPMDVQDAVRLSIIEVNDLPQMVRESLGTTPAQMIDAMVRSVIAHSAGRNYITMGEQELAAMNALMNFNYQFVYVGSRVKQEFMATMTDCVRTLFDYCLIKNKLSAQAAIDRIVGLTDRQALALWNDLNNGRF